MRIHTTCLNLARLTPRASPSASAPSLQQRLAASISCPKASPKPQLRSLSSTRSLSSSAAPRTTLASASPSKLLFAAGRPRFSSTTGASASAVTATGSRPVSPTLTWNEYLALRTKRRRLGLMFSVMCAGITTAAGAAVLGSQDTDSLGAYSFGMDPVFVLGAATVACGAVGWLIGPFIGSGVFSLLYRRVGSSMTQKETEFYRRIQRNRSDPTGQSVNNPVPDYYGEKITSVKDYRRWLKDQRAFRKKREVDVM